MIHVEAINGWDSGVAEQAFRRCCGSATWAAWMARGLPYSDENAVLARAEEGFRLLGRQDWLDAFEAHPKIGDISSLKKKYSSTKEWSAREQSSMNQAADDLLQALAAANAAYEKKHGFIFIVCATGKSPREMLALLERRLPNDTETEVANAAEEQKKITRLRLEKLTV